MYDETICYNICKHSRCSQILCIHPWWCSWRICFVANSQWLRKVLSRQTRARWVAFQSNRFRNMLYHNARIYQTGWHISFYQNPNSNYILRSRNLNLDSFMLLKLQASNTLASCNMLFFQPVQSKANIIYHGFSNRVTVLTAHECLVVFCNREYLYKFHERKFMLR